MKFLFAFVLLALPLLAFAQSNSSQCSCEKIFVVSNKNLYQLQGTNFSVCMTNFSRATGLAVDNDGNIFVADAGDRTVYLIDKDCQTKTIVARNDGVNNTWLNPWDLEFDADNHRLFISMYDIDSFWIRYDMPRRLVAREKHVYSLNLDTSNVWVGSFSIWAFGVDNGREISNLKFIRPNLWGVRRGKYLSVLTNGVWADYLGDFNKFIVPDQAARLKDIDVAFSRCGFMVTASDLDNQLMVCSSPTDVGSCHALCPDALLSKKILAPVSSNSSNSTTGPSSADLLPFVDMNTDINLQETNLDGNNQPAFVQPEQCANLVLPQSVLIDCACNVLVGNFASSTFVRFSPQFSNSSSNSTANLAANFGSPVPVLPFDEPVNKMKSFISASCQAQPTPEPTSTPEGTTQPTSAPEVTPVPTPTGSGQPTTAPQGFATRLRTLHIERRNRK